MLKIFRKWFSAEKPPLETPRSMPELVTGIRTKKAPIPPGAPTMEVLLKNKEGKKYHTIGISYTDVEGVTTTRIISVINIVIYDERSGHKNLEAYCHTRKAVRTFRSDRINYMFDPESGEVLETVNIVSILKSIQDMPAEILAALKKS